MAIPDSFLDELIARTDIVDLVQDYVPLTRKSGRYWGLCPFHSEKTPSFSVNPDRQTYYCFGCHKGGGAISFIREHEGLGFVDAVEVLARRAGMEIPSQSRDAGDKERRERLLALNRDAARWFHQNLSLPQAEGARDYLARRGLSRRTLTSFGIGYALPGWDNLIQAMTAQGYTKSELLDTGLVVQRGVQSQAPPEKGIHIYDRFRDRIIFPIIDVRGSVIGFGGRVLDDSLPKYLNSPDSHVYNKSRNLFALNIAKKSKQGRIILTEGYMDTIALHQAGFDCAVASLGTSLTADHARLISRYTKEVVIAYDGDQAGMKATQRAIPMLERAGLTVRVLRVTGAKDPDEFIKQYGSAAFAKLLDGSENHIEYQLRLLADSYDFSQDDQRVAYLQKAAGIIEALESPVEREVYGSRAAESAGVSPSVVAEEVSRLRKQKNRKQRRDEERAAMNPNRVQPEDRSLRYNNPSSARAEEGVVQLLLAEPDFFAQVGELSPEDFSSPTLGRLYSLLQERWQAGDPPSGLNVLEGHFSQEEINHLTHILESGQRPLSLANGEKALADYIKKIHQPRSVENDNDLMLFRRQRQHEQGGHFS